MAKKDKKSEAKLILEREYTVPLRKAWLKVAEYKRANRAVKELKRFLAKHMKVYDRDLEKIKIDKILNNEIRFRGMRKPPAKIRVKAKKFDDNIVRVELVELPEHIKFARLREERIKKETAKKEEKKPEKIEKKKEEVIEKEKTEDKEVKKEEEEKKEEAKEKEASSVEEGLRISKEQAREQKHISKDKDMQSRQNIGGKRSQRGR